MPSIIITDPTGGPVNVPKLAWPFEIVRQGNRIGARTVEQDSIDEVAACVYAVLATPPGSRDELPEFGMADPTFAGVDFDELRTVLASFEPRAEFLTDENLEELVQTVTVSLE